MAKTLTVRFDTTREEMETISNIAKRAIQLERAMLSQTHSRVEAGAVNLREWSMDLTACHCNGRPLKLAELLAADDFNFGHDVFGIRRYINRTTGELGGCFVPRFAAMDRA